jgi:hypothetical protein
VVNTRLEGQGGLPHSCPCLLTLALLVPLGVHDDFCLGNGIPVQFGRKLLATLFVNANLLEGCVHVLVYCAAHAKQYGVSVFSSCGNQFVQDDLPAGYAG